LTVHNAVLQVGDEVFHFSSLDGESWLPVTRPGNEGEEEKIHNLFEGDGNFKPMAFTKSYLEGQGALFTMDSQTENQEEAG
jgi:hypothetical protein